MRDLHEAALFALQQLDRARKAHRELVDATDISEIRKKAKAVEHWWLRLDDAAQQLREALHIEGELT